MTLAIDIYGVRLRKGTTVETHNFVREVVRVATPGVQGIPGPVQSVDGQTGAVALSGTYMPLPVITDGIVYVGRGTTANDSNNGLSQGSPKATIAAALAAMGTARRGIIQLLQGTHTVTGTLSLSGYRCSIMGMGPGTLIQAVAQTGPVLDLTGWVHPGFEYVQEWGNFTIEGDNTAGSNHANAMLKPGMRFFNLVGVAVRNVTTRRTPGPGFDFTGAECSNFTNLAVDTPVSAKANDVPYYYAAGACNGNRFIGLGCRSSLTAADCGVSGAIRFEDDGTYAPEQNLFTGSWFEFLHVPSGGCLVSHKGNTSAFRDTQYFDCAKEAAATGTCFFRLSAPAVTNYGGNRIEGLIPGSQGGNDLDVGVELNQPSNRVVGVKAYNGANVVIAVGVNRSYIELGGASSAAGGAAVADNSGVATNVYIDHVLQTITFGDITLKRNGVGSMALQWPSDPTRGILYFGNGASRIETIAGGLAMYVTADQQVHRDASNVLMLVLDNSSNYADNETTLRIQRKLAGTQTLQRVSMGAVDSGGVGFRTLRVPN